MGRIRIILTVSRQNGERQMIQNLDGALHTLLKGRARLIVQSGLTVESSSEFKQLIAQNADFHIYIIPVVSRLQNRRP
eukprot:9814450-Karenia_brevis.AAC.1